MSVGKPTTRQGRILAFLASYSTDHGRPPTFREIMADCGLRSTGAVTHQIGRLESLGFLTRDPFVSRGLRLTPRGESFALSDQIDTVQTAGESNADAVEGAADVNTKTASDDREENDDGPRKPPAVVKHRYPGRRLPFCRRTYVA